MCSDLKVNNIKAEKEGLIEILLQFAFKRIMNSEIYDVIIIGTGTAGSAAAYYASKAGLKTLMIDQFTPPHCNGSHHGATRIIRHAYGEGDKYVPMAIETRKLWDEFIKITTPDILVPCGIINTGPKDSEFVINCKKSVEKYNLNAVYLNGKEIRERWPGLVVPDDYIGVYELDSGYLRPELAIKYFIRLAKENDAKELFNCEVKSVKQENGLVKVLTDKGLYFGKKAALTTGTWVKKLVPNLPMQPRRMAVAWREADDRYGEGFPMFLVEYKGDIFYGFPKDETGFKVGNHYGGTDVQNLEDMIPYGTIESDEEETREYLPKYMPGVGKVIKGIVCSYDMTPDEDFIIDTVPGADKVIMITGLSGHGFKFAPVFGKIITSFAQNKKPDWDLLMFSLQRFPGFTHSKL